MAQRIPKPELDPNDHEASLLEVHKWEVYPPDPHYTDDDGNNIEWVWHTAAEDQREIDKASGDAKLKALGLTDDEIAAR